VKKLVKYHNTIILPAKQKHEHNNITCKAHGPISKGNDFSTTKF